MYDPVKYVYEAVLLVVSVENSTISIQKVLMWKKTLCQCKNRAQFRILLVQVYMPRITWLVSLLVNFRFVKIKHQDIILPLNMIYVHDEAIIASREEVPL